MQPAISVGDSGPNTASFNKAASIMHFVQEYP